MRPAPEAAAPDTDAIIREVFDLHSYTLQDLNIPASSDQLASVNVRLGNRAVVIELAPYTLRADGFMVLEQVADGSYRRVEVAPPNTMRGEVADDPGSDVRASLIRAASRPSSASATGPPGPSSRSSRKCRG